MALNPIVFTEKVVRNLQHDQLNYEAPNPAQWSRPPAEVAREGITLIKALLAEATQL